LRSRFFHFGCKMSDLRDLYPQGLAASAPQHDMILTIHMG
jgi:hypothetical protein